jgi:phosphate:Na+ symporter
MELNTHPEALRILSAESSSLSETELAYRSELINYQTSTSYGLSLFHTMFNLINTFIMIWLAQTIAKIVSFVIKKKSTDEEFQLQYITTGLLSTSELSLIQAWNEIKSYSGRTQKMLKITRELFWEENENDAVKLFSRIQKYESISDRMEVEIAKYLTKVADGRLSDESKHQIQKMLRVVSEIESVSDGCHNIARTIMRKRDNSSQYTKELNENIELMFSLVEKALDQMVEALENDDVSDEELNRSKNIENEINNFRNQLKSQNILDVNAKKYEYQESVTYMDIVTECEKMGDYIINVMEALNTTAAQKL